MPRRSTSSRIGCSTAASLLRNVFQRARQSREQCPSSVTRRSCPEGPDSASTAAWRPVSGTVPAGPSTPTLIRSNLHQNGQFDNLAAQQRSGPSSHFSPTRTTTKPPAKSGGRGPNSSLGAEQLIWPETAAEQRKQDTNKPPSSPSSWPARDRRPSAKPSQDRVALVAEHLACWEPQAETGTRPQDPIALPAEHLARSEPQAEPEPDPRSNRPRRRAVWSGPRP